VLVLKKLLVVLVAAATFGALAEKPNMVFILTDDQGWGDVGYNGHPKIKTPHLDDMAASGIRFDRFYAAASVCSPTRVSCLTGRNNWRVNMSNPTGVGEAHLPAEEITIAEALKGAGYATGHFGKWHVGGFNPETAGIHVMPPWMAGFDETFSTYNVIVTFDPYANLPKYGIEHAYWHNGRNLTFEEGHNNPDLRGDDATIVMSKAIGFIRKQVEADRPFLALVWFHNVHTPLGKNPELMARYAEHTVQEQVYYSNITAIDTQVGALRSALRELGVANNTMVWFASDNGPNLKGKNNVMLADAQGGRFEYTPIGSAGAYRGWKRDCYEGGLIVPGLLEWPAVVKQPFATSVPVVTSDYFPTALEAAGVKLPTDRAYDGISLMPLIRGEEFQRGKGIGFHSNGMQAWTETRYKIVRTIKAKKNPNPAWELYDLLNDPYETTNLATAEPETLKRLIGAFETWSKSTLADHAKVMAKYYPKKKK
jgi:arylsulfatase A-like enzyme